MFARSLGTAKPHRQRRADAACPQQRDPRHRDDRRRRPRHASTPGLTRGEGGMAPAVLMAAERRPGLRLPRHDQGRLRPLRPRRRPAAPAPGALDVYAWTERGIYRAGETVHVAALARDDRGRGRREPAADLRLHAPRRRRGPPHRLRRRSGRRPCRRPRPVRRTPCAAPGRCAIHTDPKQAAIVSQNFLVEDFVPDRIEFDMTADKAEIAPGEPANDHRRRSLPLRRAGRRPRARRRGDAQHHPRVGRLQGLLVRPCRRAGRRGQPHAARRTCRCIDDDGKANFPVSVDQPPSTTRLLNADVTRAHARGRRPRRRALARHRRQARQADMIGIKPGFRGRRGAAGRHGEVHA